MKDFKSLVSTIREMNQRNSELRKKIHNVARPEDAAPTSDQSKLVKQTEIKTKIIDEKYGKGYVSPASKIEKAMAAKGIAPNSSDKIKAEQDRLDKEYEKIKKNEETVTEASQDTEGDLKAPDENKSKKQNDTDSVDAKEIKGGKTEVVINPSTNDKLEDNTKETEDSKKTRKTENSKISAKGMKEETKMFNSHKNFGLSDSLVAAVQAIVEKKIDEKLVGNQHKIDANHNGKIDAQDFKLLKGKKKTNEEAEQIDEAKSRASDTHGINSERLADGGWIHHVVNHKTHETVRSFGNRKNAQAYADREFNNAAASDAKRMMNKEEVEAIDELSKETLRSYAQKALRKGDMAARMSNNGTQKDMSNIANKRREGVSKAINKMAEDVSFSTDELARIEAIAKDLA